VCPCGCLLFLIVAAAVAWAAVNGMWAVAAGIAAAALLLGWFAAKALGMKAFKAR
jgi:hypothetical protein